MTTTRSITAAAVAALVVAGLYAASPSAADPESPPAIQALSAPRATASPALAATAVVIGQTASTGLGACTNSPAGVAVHVSGGGASYTMPSSGVLTSWSTNGANAAGSGRVLVFVPGPLASHKTLVAKSALVPVPLNVPSTFPVRIPVQAGQQLGLGTSATGMACAFAAGIPSDAIAVNVTFNADTTTDFSYVTQPALRPNISAVLEPDADGDTFGDISQDLCPLSAAEQAACSAPDTAVTKVPKKKSSKRKATIAFSSTIAGSTFTCAVDKLAAKPCTSPFKKKFKYGKHQVVITATSPAGIVDPTPVTVKFKVKKPKR